MALERVLQELIASQIRLQESFLQLRLTVAEDRPLRDGVLLVDQYEYAVEDTLGWMEEALAAAAEAQRAGNREHIGKSLGAANEAYLKIARHYRDELASYGRLAELMRFGRKRGGEWREWTRGVKSALEQQITLLDRIGDAILACWLELSGQAARG